jgi:hypothetical protein
MRFGVRVWVKVWMPMSDAELEKLDSQEIWVVLYEAAELTGYSIDGVRRVANRIGKLPEEERPIRMRKRSSRWELWLPDLLAYMDQNNHGPHRK